MAVIEMKKEETKEEEKRLNISDKIDTIMCYKQHLIYGFMFCFNQWLPLINFTGHVMAGDKSFHEELLNMRC